MRERILLAFSGGIDSIYLASKLSDLADVTCLTVDLGLDTSYLSEICEKIGCDLILLDSKREFAERYISLAIRYNLMLENHPLAPALSRPMICEKIIDVYRRESFDLIAHSCTPRGNDYRRFERYLRYLEPEVRILDSSRFLDDRSKEIGFLSRRNLLPRRSIPPEYSVDENIWARCVDGGRLLDLSSPLPREVFLWVRPPEEVPDGEVTEISIEFEKGLPRRLNGSRRNLEEIIVELNELIGSMGFGFGDVLQRTLVGEVRREFFEAPAALCLLESHRLLERIILEEEELREKRRMDRSFALSIYEGRFLEERDLFERFAEEIEEPSGLISIKVTRGSIRILPEL